MRPILLSALTLFSGCVLDRTGASSTSTLEREMALRDAQMAEMESLQDQNQQRILQLEEVIRYRGEQEAEKIENIDQVRQMVSQMRGDIDVLEHSVKQSGEGGEEFREDVDFRLVYLEMRVEALEKNLGLKPPAPPDREDSAGADKEDEDTEAADGDDSDRERSSGGDDKEEEEEIPDSPEEVLALAKDHLAANRPKAARAVLERFVEEYKDHSLSAEAHYRLAETWFNDKEYQQAILRFQDVVDKFGGTGWASWAMVRQGECFQKLGKSAEAQLFWEDVLARYPKSKAAEEAKRLLGK